VSDGELAAYSLVELAVDRLRRDILSGRTDPGERLIEEQLTRRLGISRAPLGARRAVCRRAVVSRTRPFARTG
jgi:DNA-binding GntR family transcriptional regulator